MPRTPRVVELLRKAIEWQSLLESGEASNQTTIARQEGITRARVTQVMGLLRLSPEIQEHVLSLPDMVRRLEITERALRPIAKLENATDQKAKFQELIAHASPFQSTRPCKSSETSSDRDRVLPVSQTAW